MEEWYEGGSTRCVVRRGLDYRYSVPIYVLDVHRI